MFKFLFLSDTKSRLKLLTKFVCITQFLKVLQNNADVSTSFFQDAATQEELILLIQNFW